MTSLSLVDFLNQPENFYKRKHVTPQVTLHIADKTKSVKMQECAIVRNNVCLLQDSSMSSSFSLKKQLLTAQFFGR